MTSKHSVFRPGQVFILAALIAGLLATSTAAQDTIFTRTTTGIIRELDLVNREGVISGYRYYFGHTQYNNNASIKLYQSDAGSLEMLTVSMKVELVYAEYGYMRYVLSLQQLDDATLNVEN